MRLKLFISNIEVYYIRNYNDKFIDGQNFSNLHKVDEIAVLKY